MREDAVTRILREAEGLSQAEIEALFKALSARRKATTRRPKQPGAERPVRPEPHQQRQPFEFTTKVTWM